jgi:hypothetical protein
VLSWPVKDPEAVLDYQNNWGPAGTNWLEDGETIVSSTFTVVEGDVTIDSQDFVVTGLATVWLSGGTAGTRCTITNHVVSSEGREDDISRRLRIRNK